MTHTQSICHESTKLFVAIRFCIKVIIDVENYLIRDGFMGRMEEVDFCLSKAVTKTLPVYVQISALCVTRSEDLVATTPQPVQRAGTYIC